MKRIMSILLIMILVCSVFSVMAISAFADEEPSGDVAEDTLENMNKVTGGIQGLLEQVQAFVPMDILEQYKNEATMFVKVLIAAVKHEDTYRNIFTAILGVLGFLCIPLVIGVIVVLYVAIALATVFASVLVKLAEVFLLMLVAVIPM